jgi:hypothetical protein
MDLHFTIQGTRRIWKGCRPSLASAQRAQRQEQAEGVANILVNIIAAQRGLTPARSLRMADLHPDLAAAFRNAALVALGMFDCVSEKVARYRASVAAEHAIVEQLALFIDTDDHADELRKVAAIVAEYAVAAYLRSFDPPGGTIPPTGDPS